ncbi:MAG: RhuM family protein, partial [Paludibacteraceae bacterium]|nr:RhuM family protein [Paludibacteraceae bacterium]
ISVGYRVKSIRGTQFRQWANKVLKEYLLRGYAVNQRINHLEDKIDRRFADYNQKIENLNQQVDFFVKTSLPPKEKLFFDGQLFDAHILMSQLVESAEKRIVLIDNYIDESVLTLLLKRKGNVVATVYTMQMSSSFKLDLQKHNAQYPPIAVNVYTKAHDRFLIVDDKVYHVGASVKDLGKKLCAVSLLSCIDADEMINNL